MNEYLKYAITVARNNNNRIRLMLEYDNVSESLKDLFRLQLEQNDELIRIFEKEINDKNNKG